MIPANAGKLQNGKGVVDETPTYNPVLSNEIITLKEENLKLKVDLDDAVNALFALQPRSQVPDTRIAKDYQQICRGVEVWVRAATSMLPPVGAFNTMYEYRLRTPETMPRHMMESLGPGDPVFLTGYRCSDFLVLSIIIQRFLDGIWVRKYPVGINRSDADFMDEIEVAMAEKLDKGICGCVF